MNCKWCTLPIQPGTVTVDLRDDLFHPVCWLKKLQSIGKNSAVAQRRTDDRYPGQRRDGDDDGRR